MMCYLASRLHDSPQAPNIQSPILKVLDPSLSLTRKYSKRLCREYQKGKKQNTFNPEFHYIDFRNNQVFSVL